MIKDQNIFTLMIILLILLTFALDVVLILWGEICCWSILGLEAEFVTESWILEKVLKFAQQFSRPEKSLGNRDKVWKKMVKSLEVFWKLQQVLYKWIFFPVGQIIFNLSALL